MIWISRCLLTWRLQESGVLLGLGLFEFCGALAIRTSKSGEEESHTGLLFELTQHVCRLTGSQITLKILIQILTSVPPCIGIQHL